MRESRPVAVEFKNVPVERFKAFRARIRVEAIEVIITGNLGSATDFDSKVLWTYDEPEQTLKVICTKHPWWMREAVVEQKIRDLMEAA